MNINPTLKYYTDGQYFPKFATNSAAAADICSNQTIIIPAGQSRVVSTGLFFDIPEGYQILMYGRSGLAAKFGIRLANSVGVIDEDYVDELMVLLHNDSHTDYTVTKGDRVAQIELVPVLRPVLERSLFKPEKKGDRTGGLGSTGKS